MQVIHGCQLLGTCHGPGMIHTLALAAYNPQDTPDIGVFAALALQVGKQRLGEVK